jgi:hypothetical protein
MERVDYESLIIQDLLNFHRDESLDINPWYQRRSVWSEPQKAYLVNTIFERKPVPSIYIRHQIDIDAEKSIKEVVDGQQRIRSIISYRENEFPARHPNHRGKVRFDQLTRAEKGAFLSTALSVGYLIDATDGDVIEIFGRINSIAKTLNPQEKRNAAFSGDFKQFSLAQAALRVPFWRATGIFSAGDISRMQEVQFISDLAINMIEGLRDFSATTLSRYYKDFDADFPQADEIGDRMERVFEKLAALDPKDFSDTIFQQYQIAFSLMLVLDRLRDRNVPQARIHDTMLRIDRRVAGLQDQAELSEADTRLLDGFTGGNLHRIRTRAVRDAVLTEALG